jgi:glutathione S-transferase
MGAGPFFGQLAHFVNYAPEPIPYAINRYKMEVQRLFDVLEKRLASRQYLVGQELTIADLSWFPWINGFSNFPSIAKLIEPQKNYPNIQQWLQRINARPAV